MTPRHYKASLESLWFADLVNLGAGTKNEIIEIKLDFDGTNDTKRKQTREIALTRWFTTSILGTGGSSQICALHSEQLDERFERIEVEICAFVVFVVKRMVCGDICKMANDICSVWDSG